MPRRLAMLLLAFALSPVGVQDADQTPQKLVVFFQQWSAALDDNAQDVITHAADLAKTQPTAVVHVNGFADPTGSKRANELLTDLRAQMVADQLQSDGIDPKRIRQRGHGSVQYALTSQESRRVEISIGGR